MKGFNFQLHTPMVPDDLELISRSMLANKTHGTSSEHLYNKKIWTKVTCSINFVHNTNKLWVYLGQSTKREKLFFDIDSPIMQQLKKNTFDRTQGMSIDNVLQEIINIINELTDIPDRNRNEVERELDDRLNEFLIQKAKKLGKDSPEIMLDELIQERLLVCRHKGLLAAALIAYCVEQNILPPGFAHSYRSTLSGHFKGAHTWALYRDKASADLRLIDPRWNEIINISKLKKTDHQYFLIKGGYGESAISDMIKRLNSCHVVELVNELNKIAQFFPITKPAIIHKGTISTPGGQIRLELNEDVDAHEALFYALAQQNIKYILKYHPNAFISIPTDNNVYLLSTDIQQLKLDYQQRLEAKKAEQQQQELRKKQEAERQQELRKELNNRSKNQEPIEKELNELLFKNKSPILNRHQQHKQESPIYPEIERIELPEFSDYLDIIIPDNIVVKEVFFRLSLEVQEVILDLDPPHAFYTFIKNATEEERRSFTYLRLKENEFKEFIGFDSKEQAALSLLKKEEFQAFLGLNARERTNFLEGLLRPQNKMRI